MMTRTMDKSDVMVIPIHSTCSRFDCNLALSFYWIRVKKLSSLFVRLNGNDKYGILCFEKDKGLSFLNQCERENNSSTILN